MGRAVLAVLGIVIGVSAIVLLISVADGVHRTIQDEVASLGANLVIVIPGRLSLTTPFSPMSFLGVSTLGPEDVRLVRETPGVRRAAAVMFVAGGADNATGLSSSAFVVASTPNWFDIHPTKMAHGRLFTTAERSDRVCVLGDIAVRELFPGGNAIGKQVKILGTFFTVIGVAEAAGDVNQLFGAVGFDQVIYVPLDAMQQVAHSTQIHRVVAQLAPGVPPRSLVSTIRNRLLPSHGSENFTVFTQEDIYKLTGSILGSVAALLTGVTAIALFVGGLGVMNVMLMSVSERTREIGIRKAAGATSKAIFAQFLTEALAQSLAGGVLGVGLALAVCAFLRHATALKPYTSVGTIFLGVGACAVVGVVFGTIPALRAAMKDPVESLRYE